MIDDKKHARIKSALSLKRIGAPLAWSLSLFWLASALDQAGGRLMI